MCEAPVTVDALGCGLTDFISAPTPPRYHVPRMLPETQGCCQRLKDAARDQGCRQRLKGKDRACTTTRAYTGRHRLRGEVPIPLALVDWGFHADQEACQSGARGGPGGPRRKF
jgi:hypothetical protein